jgi:LAS superfamily LD-carboxypeptidase LdcB
MTAQSPFVQEAELAGASPAVSEASYAAESLPSAALAMSEAPYATSPFVGVEPAAETRELGFTEREEFAPWAETEDIGEAEDFDSEEEDFDFGESEDEAAHPILSMFPVPMAVIEALSRGLPSVAIGLAAAAGFRDVNQLTNIVFYFRHPDRIGRKIDPSERDLVADWISIRDRIVKPALQAAPAGGARAPTAPAPPVSGTALSSSMLQWPGATAEKLAFMRAVYDRHAQRSRDRGAGFVADLPASALASIEGRQARKDAAQAAAKMLAEARAKLEADGLKPRIRIGILSAYRPATRQFEIWQGMTYDGKSTGGGFPYYYEEAIRKGLVARGDYSANAADKVAAHLGGYVASPGYSNHQDGLAFDFGTNDENGGAKLGRLRWKSWFRKWLEANAAAHHFVPLSTEAWHWTYHPPTRSSEVWAGETWAGEVGAGGVRAGRVEVARVPVLASHRGAPPDLVLRWNDMASAPQEVDVVVHLHGFWYPRMTLKRDIEPVSGLDLAPIQGASGQGRARPTLTVLPRGHYTGVKQQHGSYYAYTFPALIRKDGLPELVRFALERFGAEIGRAAPRVGRLILTAHSGGGKALLAILQNHNAHQVHVFDALYWQPGALTEWARKRIRQDRAAVQALDAAAAREYMSTRGGALRVFYQDRYKGGTRPFSLSLRNELASELDPRLADWYRVEASKYDHFQIPRRYGWRVLADASASVPDAYTEQAVRREAEEPAGEWSESDPELWAPEPEEELWAPEPEEELWAPEPEEELWAPQPEEEDEGGWLAGATSAVGEEEGFGADPFPGEGAFLEEAPPEPLAARMLDAIGRGLWDTAVRFAVGSGITDVNALTNTLFYLRHPELRGQRITPVQRELAREWLEIRDRWVKPALSARRQAPQPAPATGTVRIARHDPGYAAYGGGRLDDSLRRLVASGALTISERDIDTLQRIADVESSGLTNAMNSYDSAVMSIGFKQWTLRYDELQDLIARAPEAFARHGIRLAAQDTYDFGPKQKRPRAIDGVPDKETLRNEDWGRRFFLAALEPEAVAAAARKALDDIAKLERNVRKNWGWSPHFDSARGRALLVELDNNRPAYRKEVVPRTLARAAQQPGLDEERFLAIFVEEIVAAYARRGDPQKGRRWTGKIMRR